MENAELPNRRTLMAQATAYLDNIKDKKTLVNKFNEITGQHQQSLPRIAVKLFKDNKLPFSQVVEYINNRYNTTANEIIKKRLDAIIEKKRENRRKEITEALEKNADYLKRVKEKESKKNKVNYIEEKKINEVDKKKKAIDDTADKLIKNIDLERKRKREQFNKKKSKIERQRLKLEELKNKGDIGKDIYRNKKKQLTAISKKLESRLTKFNNSEFQKAEKEKALIDVSREKNKKEIRKQMRIDDRKTKYLNMYGSQFTKQDLYSDYEEDNYEDIRIKSQVMVDSIKHFKKWKIILSEDASNLEVFYRVIENKLDELNGASIVLYLTETASDGVRHITINGNYLYSFEDFENRINEILMGDVTGSDVLTTDNKYYLRMDTFDVKLMELSGYGKNDDVIIYKSQAIVSDNAEVLNDCGYKSVCQCLGAGDFNQGKKILKDRYGYDNTTHDAFNSVNKIMDFVMTNGLKIFIVPNAILLNPKTNTRKMIKDRKIEIIVSGRKTLLAKLNDDDIIKPHMLSCEKSSEFVESNYLADNQENMFICYDSKNAHFEYIVDNKISIRDNIYLGVDNTIYALESDDKGNQIGRKIMNVETNNYNLKMVRKVTTKYVIFDFETIVDYDEWSRMKAYSVSILILDDAELKALDEADSSGDIEVINNIRKNNCLTKIGYNCVNEFIKWIISSQQETSFVFIGFNNANFDNFILIDEILKLNSDDIRIGNIMYNGSQLLNATINGRHSFFDVSRHLLGSLEKCCEGFKVNICSKKKLDHTFYQDKFDQGELIDYITDNNELKDYNEFDVLSTAIVFSRYKTALSKIDGMETLAKDLHKNITIGSLTYKRFSQWWKSAGITHPKLNDEQYHDMLKFKCAGRVEMFNGKQLLNEKVCSYDVCSLYPFVMGVYDVYYPSGEIIETEVFVDDKIGFYYCDIDQSILKNKNLPNIYAEKLKNENDWGSDNILENYLISSVMIKLLLKFKCDVTIKRGFYYTESVKSCEMFKPILQMMKLKVEQDLLASVDDIKYNPVLRETAKLLMNSGSGKVIEGLHLKNIEFVNNIERLVNLKAKYGSVNVINSIGNGLMVEYEKDEIAILESEQRPIALGVLIYDYAKKYMYENSYAVIGKDKLIYTDTDATKLLKRHAGKWVFRSKLAIVPHHKEAEFYDSRYQNHKIYSESSKVFGSFEDELEKMNKKEGEPLFSCVGKKSWFYSVGDDSKFKFKGLNKNNIVLTGEEDFIIKAKDGKLTLDRTKVQAIASHYNTNNNKLERCSKEFFNKIYEENNVYVLTQQFKKSVRNPKNNVCINDTANHNDKLNSVSMLYSIKKIKISDIESFKLSEENFEENFGENFEEEYFEGGFEENFEEEYFEEEDYFEIN